MSSVSPSRTSKDPAPPPRRPILAGGAVVTRDDELRGTEVLIIHRKRYDDWTLPKGKLEVAESLPACAVREVREETGVTIRLSAPLDSISYEAGNAGLKKVELLGRRRLGLRTPGAGRGGRRSLLAAGARRARQTHLLP